MSSLKKKYTEVAIPELSKKFSYKNKHMIPKLEKVVINCCTKDAVSNSKVVDSIIQDLGSITGQKPVIARAKTSIASFKVRQGMALGASVTLRGEKMYEFLDRLISISLPRVRDFRGVSSKGFDGKGNYTLGLKEQIIFPEINYDKIDKIRGMGISIVTTATTNEEGRELLTLLGMPFRK
jgi:large subunit ribosomal protein L5